MGKCATAEGGLKGFMRSGIYPYNPDMPLSSGKMEAIKAYKTPVQVNQSPDGATEPLPPPPLPEAAASVTASSSASTDVASDVDKWDALSALLRFADSVGLERSVAYLLAAKDNSPPEGDQEFRKFQKLVVELGLSPTLPAAPVPAPAPSGLSTALSLDGLLSPPQLPKKRAGKSEATIPP